MLVLVIQGFAYNFIKDQLEGARLTRMQAYLMGFFQSMFELIESLITVPGIPVVTPHNLFFFFYRYYYCWRPSVGG